MAVHSTLVGAAADIDSAAAEIDSAAAVVVAGGEAADIVGSDYYYSCVPLMSSSTPNKWWDVYKMVK